MESGRAAGADRTDAEEDQMLDYQSLARVIQEDRDREIVAAARARLALEARRAHARRGAVGPSAAARRGVGRILVRVGVWLAMTGTPSAFNG